MQFNGRRIRLPDVRLWDDGDLVFDLYSRLMFFGYPAGAVMIQQVRLVERACAPLLRLSYGFYAPLVESGVVQHGLM